MEIGLLRRYSYGYEDICTATEVFVRILIYSYGYGVNPTATAFEKQLWYL